MAFMCVRSVWNRECDGCGECTSYVDERETCRFCDEEFDPDSLRYGACTKCGSEIMDRFGRVFAEQFDADERAFIVDRLEGESLTDFVRGDEECCDASTVARA